jgi:2-amino-4-hydroxy-6-hydroxymethyldihydropteridine diphosphokinase
VSHRVYLSFGSNVDPERNLPAGLALLHSQGLAAISSVYETAPVGTRDPRRFLNAAVLVVTDHPPVEFKLSVCREIEARLGRVRRPGDRFAPRTIDVDIALWDDAVLDLLGSPVPDPDILRHLHVALPLAELAPDLTHPVDGRTLGEIAAALAAATSTDVFPRLRTDLSGWDLSG